MSPPAAYGEGGEVSGWDVMGGGRGGEDVRFRRRRLFRCGI